MTPIRVSFIETVGGYRGTRAGMQRRLRGRVLQFVPTAFNRVMAVVESDGELSLRTLKSLRVLKGRRR